MSPVPPERQTYRVYVDTSVFAACEDEKFSVSESSKRLFERFRAGDMTLVLPAAVADELDSATEAARALPGSVPREHTEFLENRPPRRRSSPTGTSTRARSTPPRGPPPCTSPSPRSRTSTPLRPGTTGTS